MPAQATGPETPSPASPTIAGLTIAGLGEIASRYDAVLCDVWGVLHNGVRSWPGAVAALQAFRGGGGRVVLITNAPRPAGPVVTQLRGLDVPDDAYDAIVTSGDVTRTLIARAAEAGDGAILHIGTPAERSLFDGLDVTLVSEADARTVVCTGLRDDGAEEPDDYATELARLAGRGLAMICANPDIVVERGDRLAWCAGALARDYRALGGHTAIAGKPHAPIYARAMEHLSQLAGRPLPRERVLAIGDGMPTDVLGAQENSFALLYVSSGIHAIEYGDPDRPDPERLAAFLRHHGATPAHTMPRLVP